MKRLNRRFTKAYETWFIQKRGGLCERCHKERVPATHIAEDAFGRQIVLCDHHYRLAAQGLAPKPDWLLT